MGQIRAAGKVHIFRFELTEKSRIHSVHRSHSPSPALPSFSTLFLFYSFFPRAIPRSFLSVCFSRRERVSSPSRLLSFLPKTRSFLPYVKADLRVSALAAAEVPPLAITMKDGHWAQGPDHSWQTHARATFVVNSGSTEMLNITMAPRHKARTSTANFYFDRHAINMLLRLVRRQITIYRWLLLWLVPSLLHISFNISSSVSFARDAFRKRVTIAPLW